MCLSLACFEPARYSISSSAHLTGLSLACFEHNIVKIVCRFDGLSLACFELGVAYSIIASGDKPS